MAGLLHDLREVGTGCAGARGKTGAQRMTGEPRGVEANALYGLLDERGYPSPSRAKRGQPRDRPYASGEGAGDDGGW
jgi:hypothetical protein